MSVYRMFQTVTRLLLGVGMLIISGVATGTLAAPHAQQTATPQPLQPFELRTDPVLQVAAYYNAINLGEYARAYSYWETPPEGATEAEFTAGFSDTERVAAFVRLPVLVDAGAGNLFAQVPVLLIADHTDGRQVVYAGCIVAHRVNVPEGNATEPDPNWRLRSGDIEPVDVFDLTLLETACENTPTLAEFPDTVNTPVNLLSSYFGAIAAGDYARAYGYWETPPQPTLAAFTQGFADTAGVSFVLRLDLTAEGAAGSTYVSLPGLVTALQTDGSVETFGGCYVTRMSNVPTGNATTPDETWRLYSANVEPIAMPSNGMLLLQGACDQ